MGRSGNATWGALPITSGSGRRIRLGLVRPPSLQSRDRSLSTDGSLVHADGEQVLVCAAQQRSRSDPQRVGDLVAVQLWPHGIQLFLLQQAGYAHLEVVIYPRQALGLAQVAGGAVRAGQAMQPGQQGSSIGDVAAHGRVGPFTTPIAVEAKV